MTIRKLAVLLCALATHALAGNPLRVANRSEATQAPWTLELETRGSAPDPLPWRVTVSPLGQGPGGPAAGAGPDPGGTLVRLPLAGQTNLWIGLDPPDDPMGQGARTPAEGPPVLLLRLLDPKGACRLLVAWGAGPDGVCTTLPLFEDKENLAVRLTESGDIEIQGGPGDSGPAGLAAMDLESKYRAPGRGPGSLSLSAGGSRTARPVRLGANLDTYVHQLGFLEAADIAALQCASHRLEAATRSATKRITEMTFRFPAASGEAAEAAGDEGSGSGASEDEGSESWASEDEDSESGASQNGDSKAAAPAAAKGIDVLRLRKAYPNLRALHVHGGRLSAAALQALPGLPLRSLQLESVAVPEGGLVRALAGLPELFLADLGLDPESLTEATEFRWMFTHPNPNLAIFRLGAGSLEGEHTDPDGRGVLAALGQLPGLRRLELCVSGGSSSRSGTVLVPELASLARPGLVDRQGGRLGWNRRRRWICPPNAASQQQHGPC